MGDTPVEPDGGESSSGGGSSSSSGGASSSSSGGSSDGGDAKTDAAAPCGADAGTSCPVGAKCAGDDDCEGKCASGTCAAPTHTDGKVSPTLGETDVDCGGATAPKCADAKTCKADADCSSAVCSTAKRCVAGLSCRGSANGPSGVDTCGVGEPGTPGALTESCCKSLPLPVTTTRRLDRYEITSGRIRAFLDGVKAAYAGVANVRAWAKAYAAANPTSELGVLDTDYPGLLDVLPDTGSPTAPLPLPVHLGAYPLDPINSLDGCYIGDNAYGHASYWQPQTDLQPHGVGYGAPPDGIRKYTRQQLDQKPANCMQALFLATFCAWDGGELARTADYHEVWGRHPAVINTATVYIPWAALLSVGEFNWRNGHGTTCPVNAANPWPGCINPQPNHYAFPLPFDPAMDDSAAIGAPGRFPKDVTVIVSANGEGWYDVGGNLMEAAWPVGTVNPGANQVQDVCDVSAAPGVGETACTRRNIPGVLRFSGLLPHVALVGYSFEAHARRSEGYLASLDGAETRISAGDLKPVTFQYGKVGGRCARPAP